MINSVSFRTKTSGSPNSPPTRTRQRIRPQQNSPKSFTNINFSSSDSDDLPIISTLRSQPVDPIVISDSDTDDSSTQEVKVVETNWSAKNKNEIIQNGKKEAADDEKGTKKRRRRRHVASEEEEEKNEETKPKRRSRVSIETPKEQEEEAPKPRRKRRKERQDDYEEEEEKEAPKPRKRRIRKEKHDDYEEEEERERKKRVVKRNHSKEHDDEINQKIIQENAEQNANVIKSVAIISDQKTIKYTNERDELHLYEIIRKKKLFGEPEFSIIEHDRSVVYSIFEPNQLGKCFKISRKGNGEAPTIAFLRIHQHKTRFTYYKVDDNGKPGEFYGMYFCKPREGDQAARQIRLVFKKDFSLNYPTNKEENLSRIALKAEDINEENHLKENYKIIYTQIPYKTPEGKLRLNFDGADVVPSIKNFVIRHEETKKTILMFFRQSVDMFKVRFTDPFDLPSAFAFGIASIVSQ